MAEIPSNDPSENANKPSNRPNLPSLSKLARAASLAALLTIAPLGTADAQVKDGIVEVTDHDAKSIEAAKTQVAKIVEQIGKHAEFGKAKIYKEGDPKFDSAIKFIKDHPKDYPNNALLDKKSVDCIVILEVATKKGNGTEWVVVALDTNDELLGFAS